MLTHFYYLTRRLRDKVKITVVHPLRRPEGARGAYVFHDGGRYFRRAYAVPVEDPTGAGDAMAGYFTALYLSGAPPERALDLVAAASTLVVTVRGDNEAVPTPAEAERLLSSL
jgi:2-dehydro-3-deoxygluconokinase/2-dehydro-3-deoxygalactonokinase